MKFLLISNLYEPFARGGAEVVVKNMAQGLQRRGHQVVVLTAGPRRIGPAVVEEEIDSIRVLRFFPLNLYFVREDWRFSFLVRLAARFFDLFNFAAARILGQVLEREKPEVVIAHNLVGLGLLTPRMIRKKRIRYLQALHDLQLIHPSGLLFWGKERLAEMNPFRWLYEKLTRFLFDSPEIVIAPSSWLLEFYARRGFFPGSKKIVLPNPVAEPILPSSRIRTSPGGEIRLFFAGQLEPHKGLAWLLEFWSKLSGKMILEIAGRGSLDATVREAAQTFPDRFIFHGQLSRDQLWQRLSQVDALVVPSLCYENAPQIIAEARAIGRPVLASRLGGIPELIREGRDGFLFGPGQETELAGAISKLPTLTSLLPRSVMTIDSYLDRLFSEI